VVAISGLAARLAIDPGLLNIHAKLKPIAIIQQVVLDLQTGLFSGTVLIQTRIFILTIFG
jgi:hypothetical protein